MILVLGVWAFVRAVLVNSAAISLENVALRHQLAVLQRSVGRPRLHRRDRLFWVAPLQVWAGWRASLVIVQPATILAWHRQGFHLYWHWKSRRRSVDAARTEGRTARPCEPAPVWWSGNVAWSALSRAGSDASRRSRLHA